ncbi:MAG: dihydrofolate synthase/folylpolyglutamate synthase [Bacteroidia bacterium]|jgi:dihydrofolate synthase/folylpolyglutamate synthase
MDLGLDRVREVAQRLDLLPVEVPVVTVAGTNGKGTTAAVMEAVLVELDRVVGVCSSPHFFRFNERIRVSGAEVDDAVIVESFEQIDHARRDISLTYFEFATLAALWVFKRLNVEIMVLEVGLGGRLDAVNIVDASVAVITSIALDHQQWLGSTRESIGAEKAGVLRRERPAVIADPDPPESVIKLIDELSVQAYFLGRDFALHDDRGGPDHQTHWHGWLSTRNGSKQQLPELPRESLLPVNICAALQALTLLGISFQDQQLHTALSRIKLRGRRERQELAGRRYILDVAHNPAAVDKLLEYINLSNGNGKIIALFSVMADKDVAQMIGACTGRFDEWFLGDQPEVPRACTAAFLASELSRQGHQLVRRCENIPQAFRQAQSTMSAGDTLVVFGSFFTVASVLPLLDEDRRKTKL